jgi:hypothetical protein
MSGALASSELVAVHDSPPPSEAPTIERDPVSSVQQEPKPADEAMFTEAEAKATEGEREREVMTAPNEIASEGKPGPPSHGEAVAVVKGKPSRPGQDDAGELEPEPVLIPKSPFDVLGHSVGAVAAAA